MAAEEAARAQRTLARAVRFEGVGLHTGAPVEVVCEPAEAGTGVVFRRSDLPGTGEIPADVGARVAEPRRTALQDASGAAQVHTVEHLLSAAHALGIDNLEVAMSGPEAPGLDGSAAEFLAQLEAGGVVEQDEPVRPLVLRHPVGVSAGGASVVALPKATPGLQLSYTLDYPVKTLGSQYFELELSAEAFKEMVAPARTFCLEVEARMLQAAGLGKGATPQNTVVYGDEGVHETELRFADEAVRHKMLDLIGDLALLGRPLQAQVIAIKSGHALNAELVSAILESHGESSGNGGLEDDLDVMDALPLCAPNLLIDRLLRVVPGERAVALKAISLQDPELEGDLPSEARLPRTSLLAALTQTAAAAILAGDLAEGAPAPRAARLAGVKELRFHADVRAGDVLRLEAVIDGEAAAVTVRRGSESILEGQLELLLVEAPIPCDDEGP